LQALGWGEGGCLSPGAVGGKEMAQDDLERRILGFLFSERHVNEIAVSLDVPVPELLARLLDMEFRKLLERRRGDYYKQTSKSGRPALDRA
ncbi:MAG: hypothetical protein WBX50_04735, partial [Candidatus Deferrimicrobiaceae bacterium]